MRMDFSTYISLYGGKRHRKTNKEAENNYRANRKINHSTTIFRFAAKIRDEKGELKAHFSLARPLQEPTEHSQSIKKYFILFHFDFLQ